VKALKTEALGKSSSLDTSTESKKKGLEEKLHKGFEA